MNYLRQINGFLYLSYARLKPHAVALYFRLLEVANREGWPEAVEVSDADLQTALCLKNWRSLNTARDDLRRCGFIQYHKGDRANPSAYIIPTLEGETAETLRRRYCPTTVQTTAQTTVQEGGLYCPTTAQTTVQTTAQTTVQTTVQTPRNPSIHAGQIDPKHKHKDKHKHERDNPPTPLLENGAKYPQALEDYQSSIRPLKNMEEAEEIAALCEDYGEAAFIEAVAKTRASGGRSLAYVATVLRGSKTTTPPPVKDKWNLKMDL